MAWRSWSVSAPRLRQGIGGSRLRPTPRCLPVRMVCTNCSAVQFLRPVPEGARFAVKLTPHGPAQAVIVLLTTAPHLVGPSAVTGTGGTGALAGWPESIRLMSGAGPFGVIVSGVWQSLQPPKSARYWPRATWAALSGTVAAAAVLPGLGRQPAESSSAAAPNNRVCRRRVEGIGNLPAGVDRARRLRRGSGRRQSVAFGPAAAERLPESHEPARQI